MKVAIAGSSGLIGSGLVPYLRQHGHEVIRLVRSTPGGPDEVPFDPAGGILDPGDLGGVDAVINLAGLGIADKPWSADRKRALIASRIDTTALLARTMARLDTQPKVFVAGSAIGWYGSEGGAKEHKEGDPAGSGFLAELVEAWEAAAAPAAAAGIRTVSARTGIVLSAVGGALAKQLLPFKVGLGGRLGSGEQYLSWISLADEVAALEHCITDDRLRGPVNLTAPTPVTNLAFTKALGRALHRPTILPIPTFALKLKFGKEAVQEMFLGGQRVLPTILAGSGFSWRHATLDEAFADIL